VPELELELRSQVNSFGQVKLGHGSVYHSHGLTQVFEILKYTNLLLHCLQWTSHFTLVVYDWNLFSVSKSSRRCLCRHRYQCYYYAVHRCGLLLPISHVAWFVCLSVCWAYRWAMQKRLNRSSCRFGVLTHVVQGIMC